MYVQMMYRGLTQPRPLNIGHLSFEQRSLHEPRTKPSKVVDTGGMPMPRQLMEFNL
jgi:hypothetical protein